MNLGYPVGSIQVPSGTELICLLRDAVTGGGYATIGTVISADLDLIAQSKAPGPGDVPPGERSRRRWPSARYGLAGWPRSPTLALT